MELKDILALAISSFALISSIFTFFYISIRKGKVLFWKPENYMLSRFIGEQGEKGNVFITFPVSTTNSGAVMHTVNYIWGRLNDKNSQLYYDFRMQTEPDAIPPTKKAPVARGFGISPNSSIIKLFTFASDDPDLTISNEHYVFQLFAWVDGKYPKKSNLEFDIEIDSETITTINNGNSIIRLTQYELDC